MEAQSLLPMEDIKQEPEYEVDQNESCSRDSNPRLPCDIKGRQEPGREKMTKLSAYEGVDYCVQGYLPVSQEEYLQVMPGDRYLKVDKQEHRPGWSQCKNSVEMEGGVKFGAEGEVGVMRTSENNYSESKVKKESMCDKFIEQKENKPDVEENRLDVGENKPGLGEDSSSVAGTLPTGDGSTETGQMFSACETNSELYSVDASCLLQNNVEVKTSQKISTTGKPFICDVCFVGFSENSGLNRHKRVHTGEKPYKCDVCGAGFAWNSGLKTHKRIHTGEKPYKCDVCGVDFTCCSNLKTHKRTHTGEKPYVCDVCDVGFSRHSDLNRHKRTHTGEKPFKCDICGQRFTDCIDLNKHTRVHTGEKPYKCDVCGVGFSRCCSLNRHKRIHTGEKPYKCDVCGAEFARCSDLKRHKKIHVGERTVTSSIVDVQVDSLSSSGEDSQSLPQQSVS